MNAAIIIIMIGWLVKALVLIMFIDAILTWIPSIDRRHPLVVALRRITEPIYRPIRQLIPPQRTGYVDLSPLIAILGLQILWGVVQQILINIFLRR